MRVICYENPLLPNQYYGFESILRTLVGEKKVKQLRLFPVYQYICCIIDSLTTVFLYSIAMVIPSIISGILFSLFPTESFIVQSIIYVISKIVVLLLILYCIPSKCIVWLRKQDKSYYKQYIKNHFLVFICYLPLICILILNWNSLSLSPSFLSTILISPILEEVVFRGYLCNILSSRLNPLNGMIFNSLCFCLLHLYSFSTSDSFILFILRVFYSFLGGIAFSCCMYENNCLFFSILFHILNNCISIFLGSIPFTDSTDRLLELLISIPLLIFIIQFLFLEHRKSD